MKNPLKLTLAFAALGLAACDSGDSITPFAGAAPSADIQVLHASSDAPSVNVIVNGATALPNVDYKVGSGRIELDAGTYEIAVEGILPAGNATVIGPVDLTFAPDTITSIVAVGDVANIQPVVVTQPRDPVSAGAARLNVLHATAVAPQVDVFVTTPGADLAASAPVGSFSFTETIGPAEVPAGDYQIRVTLAGDASTVVFDSGTIALGDGSDLFVAAVPNTLPATAAAGSPISLVALTGTGSAEFLSVGTQAKLRAFHASPDAPAVDIIVNDDFDNPLVEDFEFTDVAGYVPVPAGDYNLKVTAANNPGFIGIDADVSLAAGQFYDVLAIGPLASIQPLVLNDDPRSVGTYAKVRIKHASPTAADVDIYVAAPGTDINTIDPAFSTVPFAASTGYVNLPAGDYEVTVTPAGTKDAAIGPAAFTFADGDVFSVVARDALGGGGPLNVIVTSDLPQTDD